MAYYGSLMLLTAYIIYFLAAPTLIRRTRNLQTFITEIIIAKDFNTIFFAAEHTLALLNRSYIDQLPERARFDLTNLTNSMTHWLASGTVRPNDFNDQVPTTLRIFYNWQNVSRKPLRIAIFFVALIAYGVLILPGVDLFLRVLQVSIARP